MLQHLSLRTRHNHLDIKRDYIHVSSIKRDIERSSLILRQRVLGINNKYGRF